MAEFGRLVITDKGGSLLMKTVNSNARLCFTRLAASSRRYSESELRSLVELEDVKQQNGVSEINIESSSTIMIHVVMPNTDLTDGYQIRAIGLYANDPDEGEILYGAAVETSDSGCYVPPYNHRTASNLYFNLSVAVGNSESVQLEVNPAAYVTIKQLSTAQQKTIDLVYQQSTGYTDQRIAALINGAPSTLDTLGEIAQAMQDDKDVVDALNDAIGKKANAAEFNSHKSTTDALLGNTDISGVADGTITGAVNGLCAQLGGLSFTSCTQAEYDALEEKDPDTLYFIVDAIVG